MPSFSSEGIILKHSNFGEADRILTILTPFKGKIKVVAKGVRRITSRRAGNVEPLNLVKLQLFQGHGMAVLTEAQSLKTFPKIKGDLILSAYGSHIVELSDRLLPEEQSNLAVYQLVGAVLNLLNDNPRQLFIRAYEVKILSLLGFWSLDQIQTNQELKSLLEKLQKSSWSEIANIKIESAEASELERINQQYLERVLESPLKSIQVLRKVQF